MIVGTFNLKDMVLWHGVHSGITATWERLKYFADTILLNPLALFIWFIVILLFESSLNFNSSRQTFLYSVIFVASGSKLTPLLADVLTDLRFFFFSFVTYCMSLRLH